MTLTFEFSKEQDKDEFKQYMKEIYDYIDLDKSSIPVAFQETDTGLVCYFTDEFFVYSYKFFIEQLLMGLSGSSNDKKYLELMARYFRLGSQDFLMSNVVLDT